MMNSFAFVGYNCLKSFDTNNNLQYIIDTRIKVEKPGTPYPVNIY